MPLLFVIFMNQVIKHFKRSTKKKYKVGTEIWQQYKQYLQALVHVNDIEKHGNDCLSIENKEKIHFVYKSLDLLINSILNNNNNV